MNIATCDANVNGQLTDQLGEKPVFLVRHLKDGHVYNEIWMCK